MLSRGDSYLGESQARHLSSSREREFEATQLSLNDEFLEVVLLFNDTGVGPLQFTSVNPMRCPAAVKLRGIRAWKTSLDL